LSEAVPQFVDVLTGLSKALLKGFEGLPLPGDFSLKTSDIFIALLLREMQPAQGFLSIAHLSGQIGVDPAGVVRFEDAHVLHHRLVATGFGGLTLKGADLALHLANNVFKSNEVCLGG